VTPAWSLNHTASRCVSCWLSCPTVFERTVLLGGVGGTWLHYKPLCTSYHAHTHTHAHTRTHTHTHTHMPYTCTLTAHPCKPLSLQSVHLLTLIYTASPTSAYAQVFLLPRMLLSSQPPPVRKPRTNYHSFKSHGQKTLLLTLLLGYIILCSISNY